MVEVKNLKKYYDGRKTEIFGNAPLVKALDGISFNIKKGETVGMVGESGCGKTTAARSILRLIEPDSGEISIDGVNIATLNSKDLRKFRSKMQIVFQDPYGSLNPRMTVSKIITEPLKIHTKMNKDEIQNRLDELLSIVGLLPEYASRYPHEFSGGQRQRIGIARALALNPKFIILDEPVSALDVSIQGQVVNLLKDLQEEYGISYLFVAHDLAVVENMSHRIIVMYLGKIVEENITKELYSKPLHPYTESLLSSIPKFNEGRHGFSVLKGEIPSPESPPSGCYFHTRCSKVMEICKTEYPKMKEVEGGKVSCHLY